MPNVYSWQERLDKLQRAQDALEDLIAQIEEARSHELEERVTGFIAEDLQGELEGRLAGVEAFLTASVLPPLQDLIDNNASLWQVIIKPSYITDWTSTAVDVDNEADGSVLTADDGEPFAAFLAGDVVEITYAEDSDNNVQRTIDTVDETEIVFTETLPGTDASADTGLTLTLIQRTVV